MGRLKVVKTSLARAGRLVEEGAYVCIMGRRQEALDKAVKLIGRNVTGVRGDAANLDDLDRLFGRGRTVVMVDELKDIAAQLGGDIKAKQVLNSWVRVRDPRVFVKDRDQVARIRDQSFEPRR